MDRLGYVAMTAASRSMQALQVHANNLANINTPGFRADMEQTRSVAVEGYGYDSRHLAVVEKTAVDMRPGSMMATGRDLDFAIQGPGLIALQTDEGEAYTRHGSLQVDGELRLTINGRPVLGEAGPILLPEYDMVSIGADGVVSVLPRGDFLTLEVGRIKLVDPPAELVKGEDGLLRTALADELPASEGVRLIAGHLEASNVSAMQELVATMSLNRLFESQVKMMKAAEDLASAGNRMIRGS